MTKRYILILIAWALALALLLILTGPVRDAHASSARAHITKREARRVALEGLRQFGLALDATTIDVGVCRVSGVHARCWGGLTAQTESCELQILVVSGTGNYYWHARNLRCWPMPTPDPAPAR